MSKKLTHTLISAKNLVTPLSAWTKGAYARDNRGQRCPPTHKDAVCWCAYGAVAYVDNFEIPDTGLCVDNDHINFLARYLTAFAQDKMEHAEMLARFDLAIDASKRV